MTDDLSRLETESKASDERQADPPWIAGVKYFFITAIEAAVDVAQHICAAEGWGPPATLADLSDLRAFATAVTRLVDT